MDFAFNEEQRELRASAQSFLAEHADSDALRQAMASVGLASTAFRQHFTASSTRPRLARRLPRAGSRVRLGP